MSKKIHVRPGKGQSKVGFIAGILFCVIGLFVVIPMFGPFGIVWTKIQSGQTKSCQIHSVVIAVVIA